MRIPPWSAIALFALLPTWGLTQDSDDSRNDLVARLSALAEKTDTYQVGAGVAARRLVITKPKSFAKRTPLIATIDPAGQIALNRGPAREVVDQEVLNERLEIYAAAARLSDERPVVHLVVQPSSHESSIERVLALIAKLRIRVVAFDVVAGDRKQRSFPKRIRPPRIIPRPVPPRRRR